MREVVVVVVEAYRQAFEDGSGQGARIETPLFLRVAFEEGFVKGTTNVFQRLFFEVLWLGDAVIRLFGEESASLCRAQGFAIELVDGVQVDRQGIDLAAHGAFDAVGIRHHDAVAPDEVPDFAVIGMEDVRTIDVHHHAGFGVARAVAVAGEVIAAVDDVH